MTVLHVDYRGAKAQQHLTESLKNTGFAVIHNHPINPHLIMDTYQDWEGFFASDTKNSYTFKREEQTGYFPLDVAETAKGNTIKDIKEFFHFYRRMQLPSGMRDNTICLFDQLSKLAAEMLSWVEEATPSSIRETFSQPLHTMIKDSPQTLLRILHYPPLPENTHGAVRAAAHEDINLITLLPAGTAPGLQVLDHQGQWCDVSCDMDEIVINVADMLQEASGGYWTSTTHRVLNPQDDYAQKSRYSLPLFLHAKSDVILSKRHTAGNYLQERLYEIGLL